jgi:putative addiction module component (TIGR02574 family)
MNSELLSTAKALPLSERIELAEALWDSITEDGYEPSLTPAQEAEIDRRLEEHRRNPQSAIPWEQVKAELEQKYGRRK